MLATLEEFNKELRALGSFVDSLTPLYASMTALGSIAAGSAVATRRRLDYAAFIVVLYSGFERFVEELVWVRAEIDVARRQYVDLPEDLRRKHLRGSADLLLRRRLGTGRYEGLTSEDVVTNLHACLTAGIPYRLTKAAVVQHEQNLRAEVVAGLLATVGVDSVHASVCRSQALLEWYRAAEQVGTVTVVPLTTIDLRVKDLVDRRNQVAHSGGVIADVMSPDEMKLLLAFIDAYSSALFEVVAARYIESYYGGGSVPELGPVLEGPYRNGFVVVVAHAGARLFSGQPVFARSQKRVTAWGEIVELQLDGQTVDEVPANTGVTTVGVRLSFPVRSSTRLFVLDVKDDLVWP